MSRTAIGDNRRPIRSSLTSPKLHLATCIVLNKGVGDLTAAEWSGSLHFSGSHKPPAQNLLAVDQAVYDILS